MKDFNRPHEAPVRAFLAGLVQDSKNHAKFLNMLAMLEHMGSRKIMVSQMNRPEGLDQDTLQHLAEEARHAYFFKRHAERINGGEMKGWNDENTCARVPALMYFGRMDAGITRKLKSSSSRWRAEGACTNEIQKSQQAKPADLVDPRRLSSAAPHRGDDSLRDPYGWVSLIIELRACWLYSIYNEVVEKAGVHLPLKGLLAEEDHHLAEMFEMCGEDHDLLRALSRYETGLFETLWGALERAFPCYVDSAKAA
jgi:hypothetical protein